MHLIKSQDNSQFYRFHSNSEVADLCLTHKTPTIDAKEVEILQIASIDTAGYDMLIEFVYLEKIKGDRYKEYETCL